MTASLTVAQLSQLNLDLNFGDPATASAAAELLAASASAVDPEFIITIYDAYWNPTGEITGDIISNSGRDPRNDLPTATLVLKGDSEYILAIMNCRQTMVGITIETEGQRWAFYVDTHDYECTEKGVWTSTANLLGIWDILNYMQIWPDNFLPIEAQPISYAIFIGSLVTCVQNMVAIPALRLQSGIWDFVNNAGSLNPDFAAWFAGLILNNPNVAVALQTPLYVSRINPNLDTSEIIARTVRMESVGSVIKDVTRAYGVDCELTLFLPGDDQPDAYANLQQPTYVFTAKDRASLTSPAQGFIGSVVNTAVEFAGALFENTPAGDAMAPILAPNTTLQNALTSAGALADLGIFTAPKIGVNFVQPWVMFIAPEPGAKGSVYSCKISDHTPKGWQIIIGGKSPQWLNDLMNIAFEWIIDSISILVGLTGIPSDLLSGFLNNAFLAFQLIMHEGRRAAVGPYHPGVEVFHATSSAPYNVETIFEFINAFFDARGYTLAQIKFRNGEVYTLGKDIFKGALASVAYMSRTLLYTDYVYEVSWKLDAKTRDIFCSIGDGKAKESGLAKQQRLVTGILEAINVISLSPQGS
jgi:hypothetical protein